MNLRQYFAKTAIDILRSRILALQGPIDDVHGFISVSEEGNAIIVEILACVGQEMLLIHVWPYSGGKYRVLGYFF
jgi:hypothetical protein